jgi:oligoribonuclease NrnB/cAMP/cGMP phosphodiesterase (DHH superfamily)|tara:strand:- start:1536 stop:2363 length:828 start_codon:yes stop_codon:yes gene_type:complete
MPSKIMVLYHANCPDGFGAAWSFWRKYGLDAEYLAVAHGAERPSVKDRDVFIVDFSYDRAIMLEMESEANSLIVLDHHKSAEETCGDLDFCHFDMDHSGAYLAWAHLFPQDNVPLLIRYIEDRDLWKWNLTSTEEILSAVDSFEKTFENWDMIHEFLDAVESIRWKRVKNMGEGILQYKRNLISSLVKNSYRTKIAGMEVPIINAPFFQSEIASSLAENESFAAAYYFDGSSYKFSLRSSSDGEDVSKIAQLFGGGGHKNAAGFLITDLSELSDK